MSNTNRSKNHHDARRKLRRRLEARGVPAHLIEARIQRLAKLQAAARRANVATDQLDAIHDRTWRQPDDRRHKPKPIDPLQRGVARVNQRTARAARRVKATTRYELNRQERQEAS